MALANDIAHLESFTVIELPLGVRLRRLLHLSDAQRCGCPHNVNARWDDKDIFRLIRKPRSDIDRAGNGRYARPPVRRVP